MAGTLAKLGYQNIGNNKIGNDSLLNNTTVVGNMEENDIINHLRNQSFNKRADILEQLRISVRKNGGRLLLTNRTAIFKGLADALGDSNWDVRHQCVQLINEIIPQFGDDLDMCMSIVLPRLVPNIGDGKITIRKSVIQTLHVYMKYTGDIQQILNAIVTYGLESDQLKIRRDTVVALPMLFTPEFSQEDLYVIAESLTKRLVDASSTGDHTLMQHCILSIKKVKHLVGQHSYESYLLKMPATLRNYHNQVLSEDDKYGAVQQSRDYRSFPGTPSSITTSQYDSWTGNDRDTRVLAQHNTNEPLKFGIIPSQIMEDLNDQTNFRIRAQGVEALRTILNDMDDLKPLNSHMLQFISFLNNLLDDPHFKITTVTLEIIGILVHKMGIRIEPHLKAVVLALTKRMGDNKIVVRETIVKVVLELMRMLSPKAVLPVICEHLNHRNSKVRQEALNLVIIALLAFPSYEFDLGSLCRIVAPTLLDHKRQVRHASLECLAVLAQALGAGKLGPLVQAVDAVELSQEGDGVMAAVQARLAKRQLPKLSNEIHLEYATNLPGSATSRGGSMSVGADMEWIMAASSGTGGSARSVRSDLDLVSIVSSARSTPDNFITDTGPTPRRHMSASKGKSKLPWEDDESHHQNGPHSDRESSRLDNQHPLKPRSTWGGEQMSGTLNSNNGIMRQRVFRDSRDNSPDPVKHLPTPPKKKVGKYLERVLRVIGKPPNNTAFATVTTSSCTAGSYVGLHRNQRMRRQTSEHPSHPFVMPMADDDDLFGSPASTARSEKLSFSSSWPESKMFEDAGKPALAKKKLDPISVTTDSGGTSRPEWLDSNQDPVPSHNVERSPVPTKPALARSTSSKRKMPPITVPSRTNNDDIDGKDDDSDGTLVDENTEMLQSLHAIRSSATKKKAQMKADRDYSPGTDPRDNGTSDSLMDETDSARPRQHKQAENPFEAKPRLARKASLKELNRKMENNDTAHLDFNPTGGVTFKENPSSDVAIVGKGYGEGTTQLDPKLSNHSIKPRNRRANKSPAEYSSDVDMAGETMEQGPYPTEKISSPDLDEEHKDLEKSTKESSSNQVLVDDCPHQQENPKEQCSKQELPDEVLPQQENNNSPQHEKRMLSPLGTTPTSVSRSFILDWNLDVLPNSIVGRGVFEGGGADPVPGAVISNRERRQSGANPEDFPKGVYGKSVNKQGSMDDDDEEDAGSLSMSMSKATREHLVQRQQRSLEVAAEKKKKRKEEDLALEKEIEFEKEREKERQQEKLRKLSSQKQPSPTEDKIKSLTISGSASNGANNGGGSPTEKPPSGLGSPSGGPTKPVPKKKSSRISTGEAEGASNMPSGGTPASTQPSSSELESWENLQPFKDPNTALMEAIKFLGMEQWETKCSGLNHIRRLCQHHPDVLLPQLSTVNLAVVQEIKNLRSQVSRLAIITMGDMYSCLRKNMDTDLDKTVRALLIKSGESNKFIQTDVENSLGCMVENVTAQRALLALIAEAGHRNATIRRVVSQSLVGVVERMGPGRLLSGAKDLTDKIIPVASQLLCDPHPETRYNGQKIMYMLMSHEDFEKMLNKYVPPSTLRNVQDKIDQLRRKGLNETATTSARNRRSGQGSRSNSATRGGSASSNVSETPSKAQSTPSSKRRSVPRMDDSTAEEIKSLCAAMGASDWRERHNGITQLQVLTTNNPTVIANSITKIFDKFVPCLKDSNVKVNLFALQTLNDLLAPLKDHLQPVLALTITNVASNLASKNKEIYDAASVVLDALMEVIEPSCLLQPYVNVASNANTRIKPDMVERVAYITNGVYSRKPKAVVMHVLPLLWHLLAGLSGSGGAAGTVGLRVACSNLVTNLQEAMGPSLMEQANSNSTVTPKMRDLLQDLIDNPA